MLAALKAEPSGRPAASLVAPLRGFISGGPALNDTQSRCYGQTEIDGLELGWVSPLAHYSRRGAGYIAVSSLTS